MKKVKITKSGVFGGIHYTEDEILKFLDKNDHWCRALNKDGLIVHLYHKGGKVPDSRAECEIFDIEEPQNFYAI